VIQLFDVTAHAAPYSLSNVSLEVGPGTHALVGRTVDGVPLLLAVIAGWVKPRTGRVLVLRSPPALARRQMAYVSLDAKLPPSLRVAEVLEIAASIRGDRVDAPRLRLSQLGVEALSDRFTQSLAVPEARAVLVAEALTSKARVVLLEEPRVDLDPRASRVLAAKLRERAADSTTVVIATSSPRDALELASDAWVLSSGRLAGACGASDPALLLAHSKPTLRVVSNDPRRLLGALSGEPHFSRMELDQNVLVLSGIDPSAMADAVARSVLATGVELETMHIDAPLLEELRAAAARKRPTRPGSLPPVASGTAPLLVSQPSKPPEAGPS
jgi:ABC-type multidrug transport system ATPase subunit